MSRRSEPSLWGAPVDGSCHAIMTHHRRLFLVLWAVIVCSIARSQEPIAIDPIQIRASRRALSVIRFDTLVLAQFRNSSVGDLLKNLSPVNILDYGRGARTTASFRGTDPSHTQVYWNSLTINSPIEGSVDLSLLPLYSLDELSITPGISSLSRASGALGGALAIDSRADWSRHFSASATVAYGSFSSGEAMASVRAGNRTFQSSTKLAYGRSTNDFWFINRDIIDPHQQGKLTWQQNLNAAYSTASLSQDFFIRLAESQSLTISLLALGSDRNIPELTTYEGPRNSNLTQAVDQSLRAAINYKRAGQKLDIEAIIGATIEKNSFTKDVLSSNQFIKNIDALSNGKTVQGLANLTYRVSRQHSITSATRLAGEWASSHEAVRQTGFDQGRFELSEKLELASHWIERLSTTAMLRFDLVGAAVSLSGLAAIEYMTPKGLTLSARAGYNSHHPSLSALYYTPGANPLLRPEKGPTVELALGYRHRWLTLDFTVFDSWIEDWIIWMPTGTQYWTPSNLRSVNALGAELTINAAWRFADSKWGLNVKVSGALNRTVNSGEPIKASDLSQGVQLPFVPLFTGGAYARIDYREKVWLTYWVNGQTVKSNSTAGDMSDLSTIEPYALHNIALGYHPWLWLGVEVTCRNVLDSHYYGIQNRPMAPRYFGGSLTVRF
ncbi:MAG: TonB-dependent receptor [Mucinivorans sp.]